SMPTMRRWISVVRPSTLPVRSRDLRGAVLPGSMLYSAVTGPFVSFFIHGGSDSSTDAVQRTSVSPAEMSTLPVVIFVYPRSTRMGRRSTGKRPSRRRMAESDIRHAFQPEHDSLSDVHAVLGLR